ncbi:amidase family protein [uncultured Croceitalea sp.]|uniref:amidase family protein n=1 Tax=uncultured Croceitalea sp. TaxID=1798908 RepID=UPI003305E66A
MTKIFSLSFGKILLLACLIALNISCKNTAENKEIDPNIVLWTPYNDSLEVVANAEHENGRMRYKLIQSKVLDKNDVFRPLYYEVSQFSDERYAEMKPMVLEQDISTIQNHIAQSKFSYEELVLFYLKRIYKYELENSTTLNTVIALNPDVLEEARNLDKNGKGLHPIYGMPILLKDNIGTKHMKTTAGAIALQQNRTDDAFIVERLKENGALILGKVNLSEWAYFLCSGCPVGYSAVGGQTLNPYGRRVFETGGSSSGSGTSVAANYAVAAVGTETSGSILSPSSQNSVVGLKPTIGLLGRTGIVPISSTLDTPGPMTRNVTDNAILLSAMMGHDVRDKASVKENYTGIYTSGERPIPLKELKLGVFKGLMENDSIYNATITKLKDAGAEIVEFAPPEVDMSGFLSILNIDMRNDLPDYIDAEVQDKGAVKIASIKDAVAFNNQDSLVRIPYGQALFEGILADSTSTEELVEIKERLQTNGRIYFNEAMDKHDLDAILSINNYHAGFAAVAKYPALTIPMGYKVTGEPISLTFIGKQFSEGNLLRMGKAFEDLTKVRKIPQGYKE